MGQSFSSLSFPSLEPSGRIREFARYSEKERASVVFYWLFTNYGFREIDEICLHMDGNKTKGWQSMGIAHFLGLFEPHKAFFCGESIDYALNCILPLCKYNYKMMLIYCYLRDFGKDNNILNENPIVSEPSYAFRTDSLQAFCWTDEVLLRKTKSDSAINERLLLMQTGTNPEKHELKIKNKTYPYSDITLKETLKYLYDFRCTVCRTSIYHIGWAESLTRKQQWNYLSADVHHILPLSKGGPDSYENMICLCPNCHRKFHTGEFELKERGASLYCKDQILGQAIEITTKHTIRIL